MSVFEKLNALNVNGHTENKNGLTYLSWTWAWAEVKKVYPDANYEIWRDESGKPYIKDNDLGYMVSTKMTIDGLTHEMWLPVMDYNNNAMKMERYQLVKGRRTYTVEPATMFDVNTAIMRCLVKNLAMFGLGLYIYAGEDIPECERADEQKPSTDEQTESTDDVLATEAEKKVFYKRCSLDGVDYRDIAKQAGAQKMSTMTGIQMGKALIILGEIEEAKKNEV